MSASILAIDPGSAKCGVALVDSGGGGVIERAIVPATSVVAAVSELIARNAPREIIIGCGTNSARVIAALQRAGITAIPVDETGTTLAARRRYFEAAPPRGWRRLLPAGLLLPPEPIDDWAAVVIAERYLADSSKKNR